MCVLFIRVIFIYVNDKHIIKASNHYNKIDSRMNKEQHQEL